MRTPLRRRHAGFSIVTAIFLLVVLAGLGAAMMHLSTVQHSTSALDVNGARAYQAARAGVEWGLFQALRNNSCNAAATVVPLPAPTLSGMRVTVTCTSQTTGSVVSRRITSLACNAASCPAATPGPDYVERLLEVTL